MNKKVARRTKFITFIAILILVSGLISIVFSFPLYNVQTALYRGGIPKENTVTIETVMSNTPASAAGLVSGDKVISTNGQMINTTVQFRNITHNSLGNPVTIVVERNGGQQTIVATPRITYPPNQGPLGVGIVGSGVVKEPSIVLIPQTIIRSYLGYEEKLSPLGGPLSILLHESNPYHDITLSRLRELVLGIISVIVGIGLLKMKKWAMHGYLLLFIVAFITTLFLIISSGLLNSSGYIPNKMVNLFIAFIETIIEVFFAWYIYTQRKLFD